MESQSILRRPALWLLPLAIAVTLWVAACVDERRVTGNEMPQPAVWPGIVSDPVSSGAPTASGSIRSLAASSASDVVYVSLVPGTIPDGEFVVIRHRGTGSTVVADMVAGGLDPVPVVAAAGDTLDIDVRVAGSDSMQHFSQVVAAARRPSVVRTNPPPGKRDVPLNASVVIVFSEPIDPATLTSTSIQVRRGTAVVAGRLEFRDPFHVMVAFVPAEPLAVETTYQLVVTDAVADLDGQRLEAPVDLTFTTATRPAGPHLAFIVQPTSTTAGTVISPAIQVAIKDGAGNTVTTATDSVTVAIGNNPNRGTLSGTLTVAAFNGVATFSDLRIDLTSDPDPTGYTLTASAAGVSTAASASFRVTPGPAAALVFEYEPTKTIAGQRTWAPVRVVALDAQGNKAADFSGTITFSIGANPGGGTLSGTTTVTAYAGSGQSWNVRIDQPGGGYTLVASAPGLSSDTSVPFDVTPPIGPTTRLIAFTSVYFGISFLDASTGGLASLGAGGGQPAWSPDGRKIAFASCGISVMNADGTGATRLTNDQCQYSDLGPDWLSDGSKIAHFSWRDGNSEIYAMNADGSGVARLTSNPANDEWPAWSPDGTKIAFASTRGGGLDDIYVMNADGSGVTRLTDDPAYDRWPAWSPDGTRIAFASRRSGGLDDIYVMNADGSGVTRLATGLVAADAPAWSRDGAKIAFQGGDPDVEPAQIYVMNADGSGVALLTPGVRDRRGGVTLWANSAPAWRP